MNWEQINKWFDKFYAETIDAKKSVRGRTWSGAYIKIWGIDSISIVLEHPYIRGESEEEKAFDFFRQVADNEHNQISADINFDRFKDLIEGASEIGRAHV